MYALRMPTSSALMLKFCSENAITLPQIHEQFYFQNLTLRTKAHMLKKTANIDMFIYKMTNSKNKKHLIMIISVTIIHYHD